MTTKFKVGDSVRAIGHLGPVTILKVEREPMDGVPGRYTVKSSGEIVENFPGYLLTPSLEKKR